MTLWIEPQCAKPEGLSVKHYSDSLQHSSRNAAILAQVILFTIACSPVVAPSPLRIFHSFGVADRSQGHSRRAPHLTLLPSTGLARRRAASETYFQLDPTSSERRDLPLVGLTSAETYFYRALTNCTESSGAVAREPSPTGGRGAHSDEASYLMR